MKYTILAITFLAVGLAVGCTSAAQRYKIKAEKKEAAQAKQDYSYAQKAEFVKKMKKELAEIQEELDRLSAKVDRSSGSAKADAKTKLDVMHKKWVKVEKELDNAESSIESTWDEVKVAFKKSCSELKDSFEKTRQWLSDKIEP